MKPIGNDMYRHYSYIRPGEDLHYYANRDGSCTGELVGIIVVPAWLPSPPGHVSNAYSYNFPVKYEELAGTDQSMVHGGDEAILDQLIRTAQKLERDGCRVICADCGYFGHFQSQVADAVDVPVYLSGVIQVPWIRAGLKKSQKIGVLCADAPHLTYSLFESCGVSKEDYDRCIIVGAQDEEEFYKIDKNVGNIDSGKIRQELVNMVTKLQQDNPDLGAILLECTDMSPYIDSIQAACNLPVFDTTTMIKFLYNTVAHRGIGGFV